MIHHLEAPKVEPGFVYVQILILPIDLHMYKSRHSAGLRSTWPYYHPKYKVLKVCLAVQAGISAAELSPCSLIYNIISAYIPLAYGRSRLPGKNLTVLRWMHFSLNV